MLFTVNARVFDAVVPANAPFVYTWYPKMPDASVDPFHPRTRFKAFVRALFAGEDNTGVVGGVRSIVYVHWLDELTFPARSTAFTYHVWVP
jgi:hypothetical protein